MRKVIIFCIVMIPGFLMAQPFTLRDKALISSHVDSLIIKFIEAAPLKLPGETKMNDKVAKAFSNLFADDATIFDDINAEFDPDERNGYPYKLRSKTKSKYFVDLMEEFPSGLVINNKQINVSYEDFDKGLIYAAIERQVSGVTRTHKYIFYNHDTINISIGVKPDKSVFIRNIAALGNPQVTIRNDMDLDGVIDDLDECKKTWGLMSLNGCPDSDGDGIPDKDDECPFVFGPKENGGCPPTTFAYSYVLSGSIGASINSNSIKNLDKSQLGYENNIDKSRTNNISVNNPGSNTGGFILSGNIAYYFGKRKNNRNKGISIGVSYNRFEASYTIDNFSMHLFKSYQSTKINGDPVTHKYRRIVSLKNIDEKHAYNVINLPLMLRYKEKFSPKIGFELMAGPSYTILNVESTGNASINFESIYPFLANGTIDPLHFENWDGEILPSYWVLQETNESQTGVNDHSLFIGSTNSAGTIQSTVDLFDKLLSAGPEYDFKMRKPFSTENNNTRKSLSFNVGADLMYHISKSNAIRIGGIFTYARMKSDGRNYKVVDSSKDEYKSIISSKAKTDYTSIGLHIGFIIGI